MFLMKKQKYEINKKYEDEGERGRKKMFSQK